MAVMEDTMDMVALVATAVELMAAIHFTNDNNTKLTAANNLLQISDYYLIF